MKTRYTKVLSALLVMFVPFFAQAQITGGSSPVCSGTGMSLSDINPFATGGSWSSSDNTVATVDGSGNVTTLGAGSVDITCSYFTALGGPATDHFSLTVNATPDAGYLYYSTLAVCQGSAITIHASAGGGAWSSGNTSIATIDADGNVTGAAAGSTSIIYTVSNGTCSAFTATSVYVNPLPDPGTITGTASVCSGFSSTLADASWGGSWSSSNSSIATIDGSGDVTGITLGSVTISYSVSNDCGTTYATTVFNVVNTPNAGTISGGGTLCQATSITLSDNGDLGGSWSSGDASIASVDGAGTVTGVNPGSVAITYTSANSCGSVSAQTWVFINPAPNAGTIAGNNSVCNGGATSLTDTAFGGSWTADADTIATVDAFGNVTSVSPGTTNISYSVTNSCGTASAVTPFTVNIQPGTITASPSTTVCQAGVINFTIPAGAGGGGWFSSDPSVAYTQPAFYQATGMAGGTATITYGLGTCYSTIQVTVLALPVAGTLTGGSNLIRGGSGSLTDIGANLPGIWSSCNSTIVSVDAAGDITGIANGNTLISYTVSNSCGSSYATANIIVGDCTPTSTNISTFAGSHVNGNTGDGGAATAAQIGSSYGVAADGAGNVYISDYFNHVIRKVDPSGTISTIAGIGGAGGYNGDGIPATTAELNGPQGITLDGSGNLYIADKFNERIRKVNLSTGIITTVAGTGHHGGWQGYDYGNNGPATSANLDFPAAVAVDCGGNMYIADWGSQTVRKIDASGTITKFAGTYGGGYNGDGIQANSAQLNSPSGIAADCSGNLYIADSWNNRVRKVTPDGLIATIAGDGTPGYGGDGLPGGSAQLWIPNNITLAACGNIYVCDWQNNVVRLLTYTPGPGNNYYISTFAGKNANDWHGYNGDGGLADSAYMYLPSSLAIDGSGNIYIADYGNYVVREIGNPAVSPFRYANGTTQSMTVCGSTPASINPLLAVSGTAGNTQNWTISNTPAHGTIDGLAAVAVVTNGIVAPTNVTYTPEAGFTGTDAFTIVTNDGTHAASTTINVVVNPAPNAGTITGAAQATDGTEITLTNPTGDANGVWSSSNTAIATVDQQGNVTGLGNGIVTIEYTVTNSCGSKKSSANVVIAGEAVTESKALLYPNPNNGSFQYEFISETNETLELTVADVTGRIVHKQAVEATSGTNVISVSLPANIVKPAMLTVQLGSKHTKYPVTKITVTE